MAKSIKHKCIMCGQESNEMFCLKCSNSFTEEEIEALEDLIHVIREDDDDVKDSDRT